MGLRGWKRVRGGMTKCANVCSCVRNRADESREKRPLAHPNGRQELVLQRGSSS